MPRGVYNRKTTKTDEPAVAAVAADAVVDDAPDVETVPDEELTAAPAAPEVAPLDPPTTPPVDEPALCPIHFPEGWPAGVTSAGCIHGQWERELPSDQADEGSA